MSRHHFLKMCHILFSVCWSLERQPLIGTEKYSSLVHLSDVLIPPEVTFSAHTGLAASVRFGGLKVCPWGKQSDTSAQGPGKKNQLFKALWRSPDCYL